jgi:hypothetical protein
MFGFIKALERSNFHHFSEILVTAIKEKSSRDENQKTYVIRGEDEMEYRGLVWNITQTLFPRSLVPGEFKLTDLHPQEVAHHLTFTEYNLFANIKLAEFLEKSWTANGHGSSASLIYVMVNRYHH